MQVGLPLKVTETVYRELAKIRELFSNTSVFCTFNCVDRFEMDTNTFEDFKRIAHIMRPTDIAVIDASPFWNKLEPYVVSQVSDHDKQDKWHHSCEDGGKGCLVAGWHEWIQIAIGFAQICMRTGWRNDPLVGLDVYYNSGVRT